MTLKEAFDRFVVESWKIEGIALSQPQIDGLAEFHWEFSERDTLDARDLENAAALFTDGKGRLRNQVGMNVRVGGHIAPAGGPEIGEQLKELCVNYYNHEPHDLHQRFEHLHPFIDGNGRVGRLLWLWHMEDFGYAWQELGFLHTWYYQSLTFAKATTYLTHQE